MDRHGVEVNRDVFRRAPSRELLATVQLEQIDTVLEELPTLRHGRPVVGVRTSSPDARLLELLTQPEALDVVFYGLFTAESL